MAGGLRACRPYKSSIESRQRKDIEAVWEIAGPSASLRRRGIVIRTLLTTWHVDGTVDSGKLDRGVVE